MSTSFLHMRQSETDISNNTIMTRSETILSVPTLRMSC